MKVNQTGDTIWSKTLIGSPFESIINYPINLASKGFLFIGFYIDTSYVSENLSTYVAKTDPEGNTNIPVNISKTNAETSERFSLYSVYPNPFNSSITLKFNISENGNYSLELYNISGTRIETLFQKNFEKGSYSLSLFSEFNSLSSGIYFLKLTNALNKLSSTQKILFLK